MHHHSTVGDYLLARLADIGVRELFGVPGDYNLAFLDHVIGHRSIRWVGTAGELGAAYAADGYARINGAGALLTTYGVGELSAINGIAGACAEHLPVIHVVGAPSTSAQRAGAVLHHTLGDGDYGHFLAAHAEVTAAQAYLSAGNAAAEIDRVISTCLRERKPGYLVLPTDVAASPLDLPDGPLEISGPDFSARVLEEFTAAARELLAGAGSVALLADFLADRHGARGELTELIAAGELPHATLSLGKSAVDESDPRFLGVYAGGASDERVRAGVEDSGALISAGVVFSDNTTAGFSQRIDAERTVDVQPFAARVGQRRFAPLPMRDALAALTRLVRELGPWPGRPQPMATAEPAGDGVLQQVDLWREVERFLRPDDIVVAEQGTSFFGAQNVRLPAGATFIGQPLWGSIGYTLPAALGAQTAAPQRRTVLLIGDGAALMTAQEIGTMLRDGLKPIIVLINNDGYTVERAIHGPEERYNDIPRWNWSKVPEAMGARDDALVLRAETPAQLAEALQRAAGSDRLVLLEAVLPAMDTPEALTAVSRSIAKANAAA